MSLLLEVAIFLSAAVIAVPISRWLGLGSVLGYLAAGAIIGPWGLSLISGVKNILHYSEFGVVLLLFVIGLELQPTRLWTMRRPIFGLGGAQVGISAILIGAVALWLGQDWQTAVVAGLGLSLSSTAFALQVLAEKNQLPTRHGRTAFSILLFQDLAVIPILALLPLLETGGTANASATDILLSVLKVAGIIAAVILVGRFVLQQALRIVARSRAREVFTAFALLTVVGTALIMETAGLSMALGAFLAGVLLADSEFRHALQADIEPFKGLLLGLFFIAVGMSVNFGLLATELWPVLGLVLGLTGLKFAVLYGLGALSGHTPRSSLILAVSISQGGEFAFVIFTIAAGVAVMTRELADLLILVVTFSMAVTPLLFLISEKLLSPRSSGSDRPFDVPQDDENQVIIAGFGRYGQIIGRILRARKIGFTALEASPEQVDFVKRYGNKVYYGDASRIDLLRAAKADKAVVFILAIEDMEMSIRTAEVVVANFPNLQILARARNRQHALRLMDVGVTQVWRETYESSLDTARALLTLLGLTDYDAINTVQTFREYDGSHLLAQHGMDRDEEAMANQSMEWAKELEEIFERDAREHGPGDD